MRHSPLSEKWKEARAVLDQVIKKIRKGTPDERHKTRMLALYVEPLTNTEWNRPANKSAKEAYEFLVDAMNDYRGRFQQGYVSTVGILEKTDPALYSALMAMPDRPSLPAPVDPSLASLSRRALVRRRGRSPHWIKVKNRQHHAFERVRKSFCIRP